MRIDKFLKDARIIKRRTVAKQACDTGRVLKNEKTAKAGDEVAIGDVLTIRFGDRVICFRVDSLLPSPKKEQAQEMYTILSQE